MKRLSTFLLALMLTWIGANAQTVVHECVADINDWTTTGNTEIQYNDWSTEADASGMTVPFVQLWRATWDTTQTTLEAATISHKQLTSLTAGYYEVSLEIRILNELGESIGTGTKFTANDTSEDLDDTTLEGNEGTFDNSKEVYGVYHLLATVTEAGTLDISITIPENATYNWIAWKNLEVTYLGETPVGYVAHECEAYGDDWGKPAHWTADNDANTSLHVNKHSTEADPSGMVTPFVEYWYASGTNLPDDVLRHDQLTGLYPGYYAVSVDVRAFNESGTTAITEGATTFNAVSGEKTASADITTLTSTTAFSGHYELYGTLNLMAEVTAASESTTGTLDIDFTVKNANYNWLAFKNLSVTYLGTTLSYSIGTPQCSLDGKYVKPGSTVSITFPNCTTPNAGDAPTLSETNKITVNSTEVEASLSYSGTTATVTFTMPTSVGYGKTVIVSVPAGLISWDASNTGSTAVYSPVGTFTLTTPPFADQSGVYLYSVHADAFLSRGGEHTTVGDNDSFQSYGKIATTDPYGIPVDITFGDDGLATVKFLDSNLFLYAGGWAWTDGSETNAAKYLVEAVDVDGETVYQFSYDGNEDNYLYVNDENYEWVANNGNLTGDNNLQDDITRTYWQIFTMEERDAYKAAFVASQKAEIAKAVSAEDLDSYIAEQPETDMTYMVADAALAGSISGWDETDYYSDNEYHPENSYFSTDDWGTEIYMGDARLLQTVSGLDAGIYKVTLQGFVRQGWADTIVDGLTDYDLSIGFLQANDYQINLKPWATEADLSAKTPSDTGNAFTDGRTYANELYTYVDEEGTLELSINCPDILAGGWMIFKNLTLTYYGEDEYTNDVTWKLANPSFEVDNVVENLEVDTGADNGGTARHNNENKGAWKVESLTGWTLTGASSVNVCDLMTKDAAATDNNLGTPGDAADGTYMLYLKDTWTGDNTVSASVKQTVSLPAGDYKLTVDSKFHSGGATAKLVADSEETAIAINGTASGAASTDAIFSSEEWTTNTVKFTVATDGDVTIGVEITFTNNAPGSILLDNFKLYSVDAIEETIEWTMTDAGWGTMILPFDATLDSGLTAYSCSGTEASTDETTGEEITVVSLTAVEGDIVANTPYIMGGDAGEYTFTGTPTNEKETYTVGYLTGTLVDLAVAKGAAFATDGTQYLLQHHDGVDDSAAFYPIIKDASAEATLDAYHCYLTLDENSSPSGARVYIGFPDSGEATGIVAVEGAEAEVNGAIYDLSGRKVSKAVKGVYIQNGKKVLVK